MDYWVNNTLKVRDLTKCEDDGDGKISLNGTSGGSWGSSRYTKVPNMVAPTIVARILGLFQIKASASCAPGQLPGRRARRCLRSRWATR